MIPYPKPLPQLPLPCPSCGGKNGHTPICEASHKHSMAEQSALFKWRRENEADQARRIEGLAGKVVLGVRVWNSDVRISFEGGEVLEVRLMGGELDGHSDPPANRSLRVEHYNPGESRT